MRLVTGIVRKKAADKSFTIDNIESIKNEDEQEQFGYVFHTWTPCSLDDIRKAFGLKPTGNHTMSKEEAKKIIDFLNDTQERLFGSWPSLLDHTLEQGDEDYVTMLNLFDQMLGGTHIAVKPMNRAVKKENFIEFLRHAPLEDIGA